MTEEENTELEGFSKVWRVLLPFLTSLAYGLISWLSFADKIPFQEFFQLQIVSWSFLIGVPLALGALTAYLGIKLNGRTFFWSYVAPSLSFVIGVFLSFASQMEALICIVVAIPIMILPSFIGGLIVSLSMRKRDLRRFEMNVLVLLPFFSGLLEGLWEQPAELVTIKDQVEVRASAETVWKHIASVEEIQEEELPSQWIYRLDFPKPLSAEIDHHGVGGTRLATFEREVTFFEKVTEWEEEKKLSFTIHADPDFIPKSAFDQHIIVGGRFYDVLDGTYEIEKTPEGCVLHLESTHRLSSPFNAYAGFWSEWVMNQIQGSILTVIKNRCEKETSLTD